MKNHFLVIQISDADNWDDVCRYGMRHAYYEGVMEVLVETENGWWGTAEVEPCDPFLVFYYREKPSKKVAKMAVLKMLLENLYEEDIVED